MEQKIVFEKKTNKSKNKLTKYCEWEIPENTTEDEVIKYLLKHPEVNSLKGIKNITFNELPKEELSKISEKDIYSEYSFFDPINSDDENINSDDENTRPVDQNLWDEIKRDLVKNRQLENFFGKLFKAYPDFQNKVKFLDFTNTIFLIDPKWPNFPNLEELDLSLCVNLKGESLHNLKAKNLRILNLTCCNRLNVEDVNQFLKTSLKLEELLINQTKICLAYLKCPKGLKKITAHSSKGLTIENLLKFFENNPNAISIIEELNIHGIHFTDEISSLPKLQRLKLLGLCDCESLTDKFLLEFLNKNPKIEEVCLDENNKLPEKYKQELHKQEIQALKRELNKGKVNNKSSGVGM